MLSEQYQQWSWEQVGAGHLPMLAVYGLLGSGKSHVFSALAAEQPHIDQDDPGAGIDWIYWNLDEVTVRTVDGFWLSLLSQLVPPGQLFDDLQEMYTAGLDEAATLAEAMDAQRAAWLRLAVEQHPRPGRPVLVLDGWDRARGGLEPRLPGRSLSQLGAALDASRKQPGGPPLGIVAITSAISREQLQEWAAAQRQLGADEALYRLSQELEAWYSPVTFRQPSRQELLEAFVVEETDRPAVEELINHAGSWPLLIKTAVQQVRTDRELSRDLRRALYGKARGLLLGSTLRDWVGGDGTPEARATSRLAALVQDVVDEGEPTAAWSRGLPGGFDERGGPLGIAPVVAAMAADVPVLFVDLESLSGPFRHERHRHQRTYALEDWRDWCPDVLPWAIAMIAEERGVAPTDVHVVGPDRKRVEETLGPLRTGTQRLWRVHTVDVPRDAWERKGLDDELLRDLAREVLRLRPNARVHVLAGDIDYVVLARAVDQPERFVQLWPFEQSGNARAADRPWTTVEGVLPQLGIYDPSSVEGGPLSRRPRPRGLEAAGDQRSR